MPCRAIISALVVCLFLAFAAVADADVREGDRAVEFVTVKDARGKKARLRKYRKKVVVLTFGASWCAPCKKELPALEKLANKYGDGVVFLAINIDSSVAKGKKFMKQLGLKKVKSLFDPKKSTVDSYDPPKMPSTFVIRRGVVKYVHAGFAKGDEKKLAKVIDRELKKQ